MCHLLFNSFKILITLYIITVNSKNSNATTNCLPQTWDNNKILKLDQSIQKKLSKNLYQEAIWELAEKNMHQEEKELQIFLEELMSEKIADNQKLSTKIKKGATQPIIINMKCNIKGVFKKKKLHPSANYKFEIAAYLVNKIFEFNIVPITVKNQYNNKYGSLQYFVKNSTEITNIDSLENIQTLSLFDFIISNKDRNINNIIKYKNKEIAIDHGIAFKKNNLLGSYLQFCDKIKQTFRIKNDPLRTYSNKKSIKNTSYEQKILNNILTTDEESIKEILSPVLSKKRIKYLLAKINKFKQKVACANCTEISSTHKS